MKRFMLVGSNAELRELSETKNYPEKQYHITEEDYMLLSKGDYIIAGDVGNNVYGQITELIRYPREPYLPKGSKRNFEYNMRVKFLVSWVPVFDRPVDYIKEDDGFNE